MSALMLPMPRSAGPESSPAAVWRCAASAILVLPCTLARGGQRGTEGLRGPGLYSAELYMYVY